MVFYKIYKNSVLATAMSVLGGLFIGVAIILGIALLTGGLAFSLLLLAVTIALIAAGIFLSISAEKVAAKKDAEKLAEAKAEAARQGIEEGRFFENLKIKENDEHKKGTIFALLLVGIFFIVISCCILFVNGRRSITEREAIKLNEISAGSIEKGNVYHINNTIFLNKYAEESENGKVKKHVWLAYIKDKDGVNSIASVSFLDDNTYEIFSSNEIYCIAEKMPNELKGIYDESVGTNFYGEKLDLNLTYYASNEEEYVAAEKNRCTTNIVACSVLMLIGIVISVIGLVQLQKYRDNRYSAEITNAQGNIPPASDDTTQSGI